MSDQPLPDYYELLQVSPRADTETVERVFRLLAKRLHPDNTATGSAERFNELVEAYRVLSDPERRAAYDLRYDVSRDNRWRIVEQAIDGSSGDADRRMRDAILGVMYQARRQNTKEPGVGNLELERMLGCTEEQLRFQLWYLREKGWLQRLENGQLAISAAGVDEVMARGLTSRPAREKMLPADGGTGSHDEPG